MTPLDEQIRASFYAGTVTVGRIEPTAGDRMLWAHRGIVPPKVGRLLPAYSNRNGAISVPRGDSLFGLRPGEFTWVEQTPFIAESTRWAAPDGAPSRLDNDKPVVPVTWHLAAAPGVRHCGADYPNVATTFGPRRAAERGRPCPECCALHWQAKRAQPIAFVDDLAAAAREGRKTVTRRLVTAHTSVIDGTGRGGRATWPRLDLANAQRVARAELVALEGETPRRITPRRQVGAVLWVRERWRPLAYAERPRRVLVEYGNGDRSWRHLGNAELAPAIRERAGEASRWAPPMHMPRWACRTYLEVTELAVERVQAIRQHEIRAEGIKCPAHDFAGGFCHGGCGDHHRAWRDAWDAINGARPGATYADNPFVWVVGFKLKGELT